MRAVQKTSQMNRCWVRLALGELRHGLLEDQRLEVRGLAVLGEGRLVLEDFVEEELRRLGERLVDLEGEHAGLGLGLRQELADDVDERIDFVGPGFPERGDDEFGSSTC